MKCVPVVKRKVLVKYRFYQNQPFLSKTVDDHVSCEMKCVCDVNGGSCGELWKGDVPCPGGGVWSSSICKCVLPLN